MAYSDLGRYRFASMDASGKVGSLYYDNGRMRLVHEDGPKIRKYDKMERIARFVVPNRTKIEDNDTRGMNMHSVYDSLIKKDDAIRLLKDQTDYELLRELEPFICNDTHAVNLLGSSVPNYYYLFEVYFIYNNGFWIEKNIHPSRGYPIIINIGEDYTLFSDIYNYIDRYRETRRGNVLVFGTFYGYYAFNRKQNPFDIHNPYEYWYTL